MIRWLLEYNNVCSRLYIFDKITGKEYNWFDCRCKDVFGGLPLEIFFQMIDYNVKVIFDRTVNLEKQLFIGI